MITVGCEWREGRGEVAAMQLGRGEYTSIPSLTFRFYDNKNIVFGSLLLR